MKQNKKILTAFLMLIVTAVTLTTASYAWFSSNTSVTLGQLDVNVSAANGIQISLDAENWKATLSAADIVGAYENDINQVPTEVTPVSTIGSQTTGIFDMFSGEFAEGDSSKLNATALADAAGTNGSYIAFDLFVKSATQENIYLNAGSGVNYLGTSSTGLENSVRVGFLNQGTDTTNTPTTALALAGGASTSQTIWEPNASSHTSAVINSGAATAGQTLTYMGIKSDMEGATINNTTNFATVGTITSAAGEIPDAVVFTVNPGITKVRIYIWLEGQDVDCEDNASLGNGFSTNILLRKAV